uniref:Uncharacterized protein n=1 Tax=Oryza brachyantha TaxID=4533 RepID=J3L080_ORYBR
MAFGLTQCGGEGRMEKKGKQASGLGLRSTGREEREKEWAEGLGKTQDVTLMKPLNTTSFIARQGYMAILDFVVAQIWLSSLKHLYNVVICLKYIFSLYGTSLSFFFFTKGRSKTGNIVEWTSKDLLRGLEEFVPIYETRPIKNNMYGMGFDHSFGLWFMVRWLKPDLMIESGAFKGHSTWVLRQAMPNTRIVSLSPRHPEKYLKKGPAYVDGNCTYLAGKDFIDFGSVDWGKLLRKHGIPDPSRVLVFFDDHQSELKRLKQASKFGFRHLIFEDNYDTGSGDHYSLRQICDQAHIRGGGHSCFWDSDEARLRSKRKSFWEKAVETDELCGKDDAWWGVRGYMRDNFNHSNKAISYKEHFQNSRLVESVLDLYWELPPVAGPSLTHQTRYDPARASDPIIEDGRFGMFQRIGLARLDASVFNGYTQMAYVQISGSMLSREDA